MSPLVDIASTEVTPRIIYSILKKICFSAPHTTSLVTNQVKSHLARSRIQTLMTDCSSGPDTLYLATARDVAFERVAGVARVARVAMKVAKLEKLTVLNSGADFRVSDGPAKKAK